MNTKTASPATARPVTKQRGDYTFKFNRNTGRHGWLRLTPAYSVKLVEEILADIKPNSVVLDPFSGTATTPLCAGQQGYFAVGLEINPFLVWLGKAKSEIYNIDEINNVKANSYLLQELISGNEITPAEPPPIHNIERWWHEAELEYLCKMKAAVDSLYPAPSRYSNLLLAAFCRLLIKLSNAAFNHQSLSFKEQPQYQPQLFKLTDQFDLIFQAELKEILDSAVNNPFVKPQIIECDSREIGRDIMENVDCLITSPPYPNRMSYIRELRPYMYWLGYLTDAQGAGELDWRSIGGTWGIATSRLNGWQRSSDSYLPGYIDDLLEKVAHADNKNGKLMASYIARYFEDIWLHLDSVASKISKNARVHYIVGNSTFYNILIPVESIYKDIMETVGFVDVKIRKIRKRNSKKALFEFEVTGTKS